MVHARLILLVTIVRASGSWAPRLGRMPSHV